MIDCIWMVCLSRGVGGGTLLVFEGSSSLRSLRSNVQFRIDMFVISKKSQDRNKRRPPRQWPSESQRSVFGVGLGPCGCAESMEGVEGGGNLCLGIRNWWDACLYF